MFSGSVTGGIVVKNPPGAKQHDEPVKYIRDSSNVRTLRLQVLQRVGHDRVTEHMHTGAMMLSNNELKE